MSEEYIDLESAKGHTKIYISTGKIILNNLLGGLAWGVGTVLGATVIVATVFFIFGQLGAVPFIGRVVADIIEIVNKRQEIFP